MYPVDEASRHRRERVEAAALKFCNEFGRLKRWILSERDTHTATSNPFGITTIHANTEFYGMLLGTRFCTYNSYLRLILEGTHVRNSFI